MIRKGGSRFSDAILLNWTDDGMTALKLTTSKTKTVTTAAKTAE
jgi:hypothetical protein